MKRYIILFFLIGSLVVGTFLLIHYQNKNSALIERNNEDIKLMNRTLEILKGGNDEKK